MHIEKDISTDERERVELPAGAILVLSDGTEIELSDRGNGYLRLWISAQNFDDRLLLFPEATLSILLKLQRNGPAVTGAR